MFNQIVDNALTQAVGMFVGPGVITQLLEVVEEARWIRRHEGLTAG